VFEDTETTTSFDTQTAELLSQLEEFNPQLRLKDIYLYPNQTSYELPPKNQANSRSEHIVLEAELEPDIIPIEPEQTPPRPALLQEKPQEILLPKEKFEKFEKRMQTPDKVPLVQVFSDLDDLLDDSRDSDVDPNSITDDEIQTQDPIAKTDFMKRMGKRSVSDPKETSQQPKKISKKEAIEKILKQDDSPKCDPKNIGTSCTLDLASTSDDDIICLDIC